MSNENYEHITSSQIISNENNQAAVQKSIQTIINDDFFIQYLKFEYILDLSELLQKIQTVSYAEIHSKYSLRPKTDIPVGEEHSVQIVWDEKFFPEMTGQFRAITKIITKMRASTEELGIAILAEFQIVKKVIDQIESSFVSPFFDEKKFELFKKSLDDFPSQLQLLAQKISPTIVEIKQSFTKQDKKPEDAAEKEISIDDLLGPFKNMPLEMLWQIFQYFPNRARQVNRAFKSLIDDSKVSNPDVLQTKLLKFKKNVYSDIYSSIASNDLTLLKKYSNILQAYKIRIQDLDKNILKTASELYTNNKINYDLLKFLFLSAEFQPFTLQKVVACLTHAIATLDIAMLKFFIGYLVKTNSETRWISTSTLLAIPDFDKLTAAPEQLQAALMAIETLLKNIKITFNNYNDEQNFCKKYSPYIIHSNDLNLTKIYIRFLNYNTRKIFASLCLVKGRDDQFLCVLDLLLSEENKDVECQELLTIAVEVAKIEIIKTVISRGVKITDSAIMAVFSYLRSDLLALFFENGFVIQDLTYEHIKMLRNHLDNKADLELLPNISNTEKNIRIIEIFKLLLVKGFAPKHPNFSYALMGLVLAKNTDPELAKYLFEQLYQKKNLDCVLYFLYGLIESNQPKYIDQCFSDIAPANYEAAIQFSCRQRSPTMLTFIFQHPLQLTPKFLSSCIPINYDYLDVLLSECEKSPDWEAYKVQTLTDIFYSLLVKPLPDRKKHLATCSSLIANGASQFKENESFIALSIESDNDQSEVTKLLVDNSSNLDFLKSIYPKAYPKKPSYTENLLRLNYSENSAWKYIKLKIYVNAIKNMLDALPDQRRLYFFEAPPKKTLTTALNRILQELTKSDLSTIDRFYQQVNEVLCNYLTKIKKNESYLQALGDFMGITNINEIEKISDHSFSFLVDNYIKDFCEELLEPSNENDQSGP